MGLSRALLVGSFLGLFSSAVAEFGEQEGAAVQLQDQGGAALPANALRRRVATVLHGLRRRRRIAAGAGAAARAASAVQPLPPSHPCREPKFGVLGRACCIMDARAAKGVALTEGEQLARATFGCEEQFHRKFALAKAEKNAAEAARGASTICHL